MKRRHPNDQVCIQEFFASKIEILDRSIDRLGDDRRAILIRHHYVVALIRNFRFQEASAVQRYTSSLGEEDRR